MARMVGSSKYLTSQKGESVPHFFPQNAPLVRPDSGHKAPGTWDSARRCLVQPRCTRKGASLHPPEAETGMKRVQDGLVPLPQAEPAPRRKNKGQFPRREQAVATLFCQAVFLNLAGVAGNQPPVPVAGRGGNLQAETCPTKQCSSLSPTQAPAGKPTPQTIVRVSSTQDRLGSTFCSKADGMQPCKQTRQVFVAREKAQGGARLYIQSQSCWRQTLDQSSHKQPPACATLGKLSTPLSAASVTK